MIELFRWITGQAPFAPWELFNMLIEGAIGLMIGFFLGWRSHVQATKLEYQRWKHADLNHWRGQLSQIETDLRTADRPLGALGLLHQNLDRPDSTIKWPVPMERQRIIEGRKALRKIQALEADLAALQNKGWQWGKRK
jgi:hypothetical protein